MIFHPHMHEQLFILLGAKPLYHVLFWILYFLTTGFGVYDFYKGATSGRQTALSTLSIAAAIFHTPEIPV